MSLVAQAIKAVTGSDKPSTSQVKAFAETVRDFHNTGVVEHPDTGEHVPWTELPDAARLAVLRENVTNNAYERLQRQKNHIEDSKAHAARPNVVDWLDDYGTNNLTPDQQIVITRARYGYTAKLIDETSGEVLAEAEGAYFKKALLGLIDLLGTTKGETM
ncbi:hypothetical protein [Deinococcus yavapaiensis]|uniref:Uncharacterized protein n=1 Tax=Deinococcus yavapaiensis KR-236 TaxID=694435 RepID=A0A318S7N4_9DEIO|nr:hypothetical protein [Deinococcus yavapaiensis]PYE51041.1 hypothetical protein DES52_116108 [Deinococcus yavapaiensis KR-236]